jgi:hypothetical protein
MKIQKFSRVCTSGPPLYKGKEKKGKEGGGFNGILPRDSFQESRRLLWESGVVKNEVKCGRGGKGWKEEEK